MKKRNIVIIIALIIIIYIMYNNVFYLSSFFGSVEVVDKQESNGKFELVVQLIDEGREQAIEINDDTSINYNEEYHDFTEDIWESIAVNTKYHMNIKKYRFPTSVFKGEYRLELIYLD